MVAVSLAIQLLLLIALGILISKIKLIDKSFAPQLSTFLLNVALPCLVFSSISSLDSSPDMLKSCGIVLVLSIVVCLLLFIIGQIVYKMSGKSSLGRLLRYAIVMPQFSFMGIPVVDALFGAVGNLYYTIFIFPVRIIYYGMSTMLMMPSAEGQSLKLGSVLKALKSPALLIMPLAFLFYFTGWAIPEPIKASVSSVAKTCSPLGLMLCGIIVGQYDFKRLLKLKYLLVPVISTVGMPLMFFLLTRLLAFTSVDPIILNMIVLFNALPLATFTPALVMTCEPDNTDAQFESAGATLIALMMSVVTVPVWYYILLHFGG